MRFSLLASGSKGNVCYIETRDSRILIDAGLSCKELVRRLEMIGQKSIHLDAIIITHEHGDHIKGVGPVARRFDVPVFMNHPTLQKSRKILGNISTLMAIHTGQAITIHDTIIETFTKCHDAADPMGMTVSSNGSRLGLVTDLGRSTRLVEDRLKGCQCLIIEFNHDGVMLEQGPYPLDLKRRVRGPEGHLSNQQAGQLLESVSHKGLTKVVLAHLSEVNNLPEKAFQVAKETLSGCSLDDTEILISQQHCPMEMVEV
jgi:phosphoribosyl 1,2-cyclic phosphodiesterase